MSILLMPPILREEERYYEKGIIDPAGFRDEDVFKGKLFAPNVILENKAELSFSKQQFTEIRKAVVEVQANVAEHEWDMAEAYQNVMAELDKSPISEEQVLGHIDADSA
jgi:hypothetical protein